MFCGQRLSGENASRQFITLERLTGDTLISTESQLYNINSRFIHLAVVVTDSREQAKNGGKAKDHCQEGRGLGQIERRAERKYNHGLGTKKLLQIASCRRT